MLRIKKYLLTYQHDKLRSVSLYSAFHLLLNLGSQRFHYHHLAFPAFIQEGHLSLCLSATLEHYVAQHLTADLNLSLEVGLQ
jgi:hypothetical protein